MVTTGKPSYDPDHPDYVPSLFNGRQSTEKKEYAKVERYERVKKRRIQCDELPSRNEEAGGQEDEDDITTLKSKISELIKEKEVLVKELPTLKSNIN